MVSLNPVGQSGDYIAFPLLADIGFSVDPGQKAIFYNVIVTHYREPSNELFGEDLNASDYKGIFAVFANDSKSGFSVKEGAYMLIHSYVSDI